MIPFMTEDIYQNLVRSIDKEAPESIHLCDYPEVKAEWIDKTLEEDWPICWRSLLWGGPAGTPPA